MKTSKPPSVLRVENALGVIFSDDMLKDFYARALVERDTLISRLCMDIETIKSTTWALLKEREMEEEMAVKLADELSRELMRIGIEGSSPMVFVPIDPTERTEIKMPLRDIGLLLRALAAYQPPSKEDVSMETSLHNMLRRGAAIHPYGEGLPYMADKENREDASRIAGRFGLQYGGKNRAADLPPSGPEKNIGEQIVDALLKAGIIKP